ncbi:MAG: sulfatase [Myxococcales bacterium]|nr:sulfatase [Myxococcales bacterium]
MGSAKHVVALQNHRDINVLFVLIDTLRASRLASYGSSRETSPNIDYMASTGVRFARQLAQSSWTKCSMASLWTGRNPARTGVLRAEHALPLEAVLPAELLRDAGFRTAGIWRNGWVDSNFGFSQGFEVYERPRAGRVPATLHRKNPNISLDGTDADVVSAALDFLRVYGRDRWFLYIHMMDVHQYAYSLDSAIFGGDYLDIYDNSIHHTDNVLGRLLNHLAETELLKKTLVVIASDHAEAFMERGFEGHATQVYPESTEVPLVIAFPFLLDPGVAIESRTRNVDIWPTILDLLGLPELPDTDGRSLVPEILAAVRDEEMPVERPPAIAHLDRNWGQPEGSPPLDAVALEEGGFRMVRRHQGRDGSVVIEELFDRESDPDETLNVIGEHPEEAERLRGLVDAYLDPPVSPWGVEVPSVEIDEMELNQLRALGYAIP